LELPPAGAAMHSRPTHSVLRLTESRQQHTNTHTHCTSENYTCGRLLRTFLIVWSIQSKSGCIVQCVQCKSIANQYVKVQKLQINTQMLYAMEYLYICH